VELRAMAQGAPLRRRDRLQLQLQARSASISFPGHDPYLVTLAVLLVWGQRSRRAPCRRAEECFKVMRNA
jgi:hypothetical protein